MTNDDLIDCVRRLRFEFENSLAWYMQCPRRKRLRVIEESNELRGLYEGTLRLAQDRGISLENFFDYEDDSL